MPGKVRQRSSSTQCHPLMLHAKPIVVQRSRYTTEARSPPPVKPGGHANGVAGQPQSVPPSAIGNEAPEHPQPAIVEPSAVRASQPVVAGEQQPVAAADAAAPAAVAADGAEDVAQLPVDDGTVDLDSRLKVRPGLAASSLAPSLTAVACCIHLLPLLPSRCCGPSHSA